MIEDLSYKERDQERDRRWTKRDIYVWLCYEGKVQVFHGMHVAPAKAKRDRQTKWSLCVADATKS